MKLTTSCIITKNIEKLTAFYSEVLQIEPQAYGDDYVEFETGQAALSLYSLASHEKLAPDSVEFYPKGSIILEFMVDDVEAEFRRLSQLEITWIKEPTTQPWGNRSIYFRDPEGNFINFYSREG